MLALPCRFEFSVPVFLRVESATASILLALAGMLPVSFPRLDRRLESEPFHLSKYSEINESDNADTEQERVCLKIADLN